MITLMQVHETTSEQRVFVAQLVIPEGAQLQCGVLVNSAGGLFQPSEPLWYPCPPNVPGEDVRLPQNLVLAEIGPYLPGARRMLVWGAGFLVIWTGLSVADAALQRRLSVEPPLPDKIRHLKKGSHPAKVHKTP